MTIKAQALENFEENYIKEMMNAYERNTKWYSIISQREVIEKLKLEEKEDRERLTTFLKFLKTSVESASYRSGFEIIKQTGEKEDPYEYLEQIKKEQSDHEKVKLVQKIIQHIETHKAVYCMKDIIYTKINLFWENVAFLNRLNNKKDIKQEYKNTFVLPAQKYLQGKQKSEYNCIECGNIVSKSETMSMSWLKDVGVDINRKKSGFWNFNEDTFLCPICSLVYSCVPIGFSIMGSSGIFINNNESIEMLIKNNKSIESALDLKKDTLDKAYQTIFQTMINEANQIKEELFSKKEIHNIQVVRRIGLGKDNQKYEFNTISKDKLKIFDQSKQYFERLMNKIISINGQTISIYQTVLSNFLEGKKQYEVLNLILTENINTNNNVEYVENILKIQLNSIGGTNVKERSDRIEEMIKEGESLQKYFHVAGENENKLKSYRYKIQSAIKSNNIEEFMKIFTTFYGGIERGMPRCEAMRVLMKEPEYFRLLGEAYVYGLGKMLDKKEEVGGNKNEE